MDPADAQDVATKQYVDMANRAFVFGEGRYMAVTDVSMGGRRINNVGMPVENHQASNKFYVDTIVEATITANKDLRKIQDGIFASTGEIDMSGNSITGLPNPIGSYSLYSLVLFKFLFYSHELSMTALANIISKFCG